MEFSYCRKCRKAYTSGSAEYCSDCIKEMDESVKIIRDYLDEHHGATVAEISRKTDVSKKDIVFLLREGRLEIEGDSEGALTCDRCGKNISTGRYCKECLASMGSMFSGISNEYRAKKEKQEQAAHPLSRGMHGQKMKIDRRDSK